MDQDHAPTLDTMLCFALYSAAHAVQHVYKPLLSELGLTYPQYLVLISLWQEDGQTVGSIGSALHLETNTLTPLLKRMETAGLVQRTRSKQDKRRVILRLTDKGRQLQDSAARLSATILCRSGMGKDAMLDLQWQITSVRDQFRSGS